MTDSVNQPSHYTYGAIEVIDVIEGLGLNFHEGNIVKYVARWRRKNGVEDLKKARWYLDRLIEKAESQPSKAERLREANRIEAMSRFPVSLPQEQNNGS